MPSKTAVYRGSWAGCLLGTTLLLAGCTVGPEYVRPEPITDIPDSYVVATETAAEPDRVPPPPRVDPLPTTVAWWNAFGSTELDSFVSDALRYNTDLAQAAARVLESRALLKGSRAARWPSLEVGGTAQRSKLTLAQFGGSGSIYNTLYSATATAFYEIDLFGRLSRAEEASFAELLASDQDRRTVQQTLIADVVRTWLEIRELECQLALNSRTIDNFAQNLRVIEERFRRGLAPAVDVHLARQNLLAAKALKPQWEQLLNATRRRLEILVGRYPAGTASTTAGDPTEACSVPPPLPPVPTGLPSTLLERRPDILAAEARLHAATARIGEAKATLFPRLSLTGEGGFRSVSLSSLFMGSSTIWSIIGNLSFPLLNWGQQLSQIGAAEARTARAVAAYQGTVLNAFREVEAALDAERNEWERRQWLEGSVDAARHSLELAELRYLHGLDNLLLTLDTQRRLYTAEIELISTERQWRAARVDLILALGGHWDDPAQEQQVGQLDGALRYGDEATVALELPAALAVATHRDHDEEAQGVTR